MLCQGGNHALRLSFFSRFFVCLFLSFVGFLTDVSQRGKEEERPGEQELREDGRRRTNMKSKSGIRERKESIKTIDKKEKRT